MNTEFSDRFSNWWRVPALGALMMVVWLGPIEQGKAADTGQQIFQSSCAVCHTIGGGRLIGPDLAGIHKKRTQKWLEKFVKSSQSMIKAGDADAIAVFEEYNKIAMPDFAIPDGQIKAVLGHIKSASTGSASASSGDETQQAATASPASKEDILLGQKLFQGKTRFENKGPTCISCHHVKNDAVIGGGVLAKELTTVFSRMGGTKQVRLMINNTPFPVMQIAYKDKVLTEKEVTALVAFLQDADEQHAYQNPRDYGVGLLISGFIGAGILFVFYSLLWLRRRKDSVNQEIYDRQVKST